MSTAPIIPVSIQVPADPGAPVIADFAVHALRVALVHRRDLEGLPFDWAAPGIYVLLGAGTGLAKADLYVGQAVELRKRLFRHRADPKLDWWRAVAVKRDTTHGFNSAEIGYLEGRVAAQLGALPGVHVIEGKKDQDTTLPPHHMHALDDFVPSVLAALRIAGLDLAEAASEDGQPAAAGPKHTHTPIPGSVSDLLAVGLLTAGTTLTFKRAGKSATARVASSGDLIVDGVSYTSPSTAAKIALGLKAANGWVSWRLEDGAGPSLAELRTQLPEKTDE